ncbi:TIGR01841 family phasin [Paraburkholderia fungorum]|uniref:Phasin (PHA-granule associated protein) n=1 Tax=Paraburkholderia fungorum TaxID=134537 RepID=A0A3R7HI48_9BURK|nr:TIGR01841 family phasin [Paraburkholderia fungorum]RKF46909.1 Phasin (PHA-granule associated protein) [Paraburkholderia fungorum]
MTLLSPEQNAAVQANVDTFFGVAGKIFEGVEKLAALNLQAVRATLAETQESIAKVSGAEPQQWFALQAESARPGAEKSLSYGRQVFEIASATQAEVTQLVEAYYERYNNRVQSLVEEAAKRTPSGSEAAIAAWKSAIASTTTLFETLQKTGQQAVTMAQSNLEAVTATATNSGRSDAGPAPAAASAKR